MLREGDARTLRLPRLDELPDARHEHRTPTGTLKLRLLPVKKAHSRQMRGVDRDGDSSHEPDAVKSLRAVEFVNKDASERFELPTVEEVAELLRVTPRASTR